MQAKDIMTTPVVSVAPQTSVQEVARLLLEKRISAAPVVDTDGRLVGIVSEGDFLRRAEGDDQRRGSWWLRLLSDTPGEAADYVKTHGRVAGDVMSRDVITVAEDTPVGGIAHLLEANRIKRVPVLHENELVGIVSRADLLRGLASRRETPPAAVSQSDEAIRQQLLDKLASAEWAPLHPIGVLVTDGVVELWGVIDTAKQRDALRISAEEVPGVRRVEVNVGTIPAYAWGE